MGIDDRDYMRNRQSRRGDANYYPKQFRSRPDQFQGSKWKKFIAGMLVLLALGMGFKYLLEHKSTLPFPQTGDVQWFVQNQNGKQALLTIAAPATYKLNYAIQLDQWADQSPVVTIYVRAGETAFTLVPLGRYRVTIAKGKYWQGSGKSFGFTGDTREAVAPLEFYQTGNTVVGHTIELDKSLNGNMETRPAWHM